MFKKVVRFLSIVLALTIVMGIASPVVVQAKRKKTDDTQTQSIKVLMIGNSHSHYACKYLYDIFKTCGYDDVIIGFCMRGGQDLKFIYNSFVNDSVDVTYSKNTEDEWLNVEGKRNATVREALEDEEWDYVFLQNSIYGQVCEDTYYLTAPEGIPTDAIEKSNQTFIPKLLIDGIKEYCPNAKIGWSMIHATDGTALKDDKYEENADKLYADIVTKTKKIIYDKGIFDTYAWSGPVMEKMLHSYLKGHCLDKLNRHAAKGLPRYAMGLTVAAACGADISQTKRVYIRGRRLTPYNWDRIKQYIEEANANPWATDFVNEDEKNYLDSPDINSIQAKEKKVKISWQDVGAINYTIKFKNARGRWRTLAKLRRNSYTFKKSDLNKAREYEVVARGDRFLRKSIGKTFVLYFEREKTDNEQQTVQIE